MAYSWEFRNPCVGGCVYNQERSEKALISQNWLTLKLSAEAGNRNKGRVCFFLFFFSLNIFF